MKPAELDETYHHAICETYNLPRGHHTVHVWRHDTRRNLFGKPHHVFTINNANTPPNCGTHVRTIHGHYEPDYTEITL